MARRNTEQMDLLSYRAPKPKARRKPAAVKVKWAAQVKFGPAEGELGYGRSMPILARIHRHHDWQPVGWVDVEAYDLNENIMGDTEDLRVSEYTATLNLDLPYSAVLDADDYEHNVEVMVAHGRWPYSMKPVRTATEAKRMVKEWAIATLETVGWGR